MPAQIVLFIIMLAAVAVVVLFNLSGAHDNLRLSRLFYAERSIPTKKLGRLWIDEKSRKWAAPSANRLYSFSEVLDCDILADGISLGAKQKMYNAGASGSDAAACGNKTFERIVVVVIVGDKPSDTVNIPIGGGAVRFASKEFDKYMRLAEDVCKELDNMKKQINED